MYITINTAAFPYPPGEQFIESEIDYWGEFRDVKVEILPSVSRGSPRPIPGSVAVRPAFPLPFVVKIFFALHAVFHHLFWGEIRHLLVARRINAARCFLALKSVASVLWARTDIRRRLKGMPYVDLAYSYWNNETAYALCLLKREGRIGRVISRAHRFDLYEERRPAGYMPVKRQFANDFDCMHAISDDACAYLTKRYGFPAAKMRVSRLGVTIPDRPARASRDGVVRILSVSFCVPVKRIHKIVEAIHYVCSTDATLFIEWIHIGDGVLRPDLEDMAGKMLGGLPNAGFRFAGMLSNEKVLEFMKNNEVDIFMNTSSSEGVPVSIMEAMAYGIPAIAPDVGGVAELVNRDTGVLLRDEMKPEEIHAAIQNLTGAQAEIYRRKAREFVEEKYSASRNYSRFVHEAITLAGHVDA